MVIGPEYETSDDPDTNNRWDWFTRQYAISKSQPVCLDGADGQSNCWTPTKVIRFSANNVEGHSATAHASNAVLQPFDPEDSHPDKFLKVVTGHPNIVKPIAHGQCKDHRGSPIAKCSAQAMEMPAMTALGMLEEFVQNSNRSPPLEKSQVRKIVTDVAKGLQHIHTFGWLYNNMDTASIYLYKEPGSGQFTAKLGDFRSAMKSTNSPNWSSDIFHFGYIFLDKLVTAFYYKAKKHTGTKSPCVHPSPGDIWLASMCDIVVNLDRISQKLLVDEQPTLKQVLEDEWLNGTN